MGMMKGEYTVQEVANWFLEKESMDQKKLQKLCYYAYAWYLYLFNDIEDGLNRRLFANDIEGWVHGPVSHELYKSFPYRGIQLLKPVKSYGTIVDTETVHFLEEVYDVFGKYTGNELEIMTHKEEPWLESRKGLKTYEPGDTPLDDNTMYNFCAIMSND